MWSCRAVLTDGSSSSAATKRLIGPDINNYHCSFFIELELWGNDRSVKFEEKVPAIEKKNARSCRIHEVRSVLEGLIGAKKRQTVTFKLKGES